MSASAGRVLLMLKGTYDATVTYEMLDMVRYGNSTFVCKKTSTGNTPDENQDTEYWQLIVSSSDVSGVKGNAESTYRTGNVNLTFADLGIDSALSSTSDNAVKNKTVYAALGTKQDKLTFDTAPTSNSNNPVTSGGIKTVLDGKLSATSDTKTNVTTFTSSDNANTTEKTSNGFTSVVTMASGESHSSLFQKISKMFLNIRKLWNTMGTSALASDKTITGLLGNTTIPSGLGTTITGALSNLDTKKSPIPNYTSVIATQISGSPSSYTATADCFIHVNAWSSSQITVSVNSVSIQSAGNQIFTGQNYAFNSMLYLKKGDTVSSSGFLNYTVYNCR